MATMANTGVLSDELLEKFFERAPTYDRENRFFQEDFDDMKAAGYLKIAVPKELGGGGLTFTEDTTARWRSFGLCPPVEATAISPRLKAGSWSLGSGR